MIFDRFLKNCAYCGRSFGVTRLYCDECWAAFLKKIKSTGDLRLMASNIKVKPLVKWKKNDKIIDELIYGLKGGGERETTQRIAKALLLKNGKGQDNKGVLIVPVPPSSPNQKDHARSLAEEVARQFNCAIFLGLEWDYKPLKQRYLNKKERFKIKIKLKDKAPPYKKIILLDDVVTTGATARAAYEAFQSPKEFEVWCIACR